MKPKDTRRLAIRIATLPAPYKDSWTFAAGAFAWTVDGHQWVPIVPAHDTAAPPLGKARIHEAGDALCADLVFKLESKAMRDWCRKLPRDPVKARDALKIAYSVNPFRKDEARRLVTHADVLALSVSLGTARKHWPPLTVPKEDPAGETIAAMIDTAAREQDRS